MRDLEGLPPEILLIPLAGHTRGHAGIAVQEDDSRWLFYAGDAYFHHAEIAGDRRTCPPGLRGYQRLMQVGAEARLVNQRRVRALSTERADAVRIFCAHDLVEFEALSGAS